MADARLAVTDARAWVRNLISIVISSAIASAALGARHQKWVGPPPKQDDGPGPKGCQGVRSPL
jgi:hypothetical protein